MKPGLTFHVPPDASPEAVQAHFHALLGAGDAPLSPATLRDRAAAMLGRQPRGEALSLIRDLALVTTSGDALVLTPRGQVVAADQAASDLVHGFSYFGWSARDPARLSRLWSYRALVDALWELAPVTVDAALKKRLVEDLLARAEACFEGAGIEGFASARASVGPKSVDGVLRWLERLDPAVLCDRRLERRQRCPPQLMALAVAAMVGGAGAERGTDFRLGAEERTLLCRVCFIEPSALDAMLDWTMQSQPHRVRWGTANARYGRQLMLLDPGPLAPNALTLGS
ncbi:MAG: hypothetical protein ACYDCQ_01210 [Dehalococcoidia bacterium]